MAVNAPRTPERILNFGAGPPEDGLEREWDVCPDCGCKRWQLVIVPTRFHCDRCEKAGPGPNVAVTEPEPEQTALFSASNEGAKAEPPAEERPPVDDGDAWMADEMPDE